MFQMATKFRYLNVDEDAEPLKALSFLRRENSWNVEGHFSCRCDVGRVSGLRILHRLLILLNYSLL
jgi:hypothetical protein